MWNCYYAGVGTQKTVTYSTDCSIAMHALNEYNITDLDAILYITTAILGKRKNNNSIEYQQTALDANNLQNSFQGSSVNFFT